MSQFTFYWHDYETFGADPARDRPSQFAGIRTDADFNIVGDPLVIFCKPQADMLPQPEACLITGITPQQALEQGVDETEFIRQIHAEFIQPQTCAVGYNSIRFDDEVTRYTLYRNFYDAYEREWKNGNSRWDIIDMVRVCRALRPEGIVWPDREDGTPSFKLEDLTRVNGIEHTSAHDALSDVYATIAIAKLIKQRQPKMFDYLFALRNKREVGKLLDIATNMPVLHTSAMFPASRYCTTLVMPLALHPTNKNAVICYDLSVDPSAMLAMTAEQIRARVYTPTSQLPEGEQRIALKTIHSNRCPVVVTSKVLDETLAQRIQLDLPLARSHYQQLKNAADIRAKVSEVFLSAQFPEQKDPDVLLYGGGFFSDNDREVMAQVRSADADQLSKLSYHFEDGRLAEMLFRYRARNFPSSLSEDEQQLWSEHCFSRLTEQDGGGTIVMEAYNESIEQSLADPELSVEKRRVLQALQDYGDMLLC